MADLLIHLCSALLPGGVARRIPAHVFAVGAVLPDVSSRLPAVIRDVLVQQGWPIPLEVGSAVEVLHMCVGAGSLSVLLALLFPEAQRPRMLVWLLAGVGLHFGLDLLQDHHGYGYTVLYPLTTWDGEPALLWSAATVRMAR